MTSRRPAAGPAEGIYRQDVRDPRRLRGVRLDVAGFVGVALRGPVERADRGGQLG